jgi:cytochrome c biogenesis factor
MFIVLFVLLFYIVHCCIDIEDRSLSGLYFNKIILSYLDWIMPFLTVCERRIRSKRFIKRQVNWFRKYSFRYMTLILDEYMFIVLFVLLFYIGHCCIDIEDRSLSGLYFNKIFLSYLILSYECMKV